MITGRNSEWDGIKREVLIDLEERHSRVHWFFPRVRMAWSFLRMAAEAAAIAPGTAMLHRYSTHRELPLC